MVSDYHCDRCAGAIGLLVQHGAFLLRCTKCNAPGSGALLQDIADTLQGRYRAVLLDRDSREVQVIAEGPGTAIVPAVLAACEGGGFVQMTPLEEEDSRRKS